MDAGLVTDTRDLIGIDHDRGGGLRRRVGRAVLLRLMLRPGGLEGHRR